MNKLKITMIAVLGVIALGFLLLRMPVPLSKEQVEFDQAVYSAQKLKLGRNCEQSLKILNTLKEEYPSTAIYIELETDGCLTQKETFESCLNSKLTEYMPTRAALCTKRLADAGKFEEAASIWEKDIQEKPEEIFPYTQISGYEQGRLKLNMTLNSFKNKKANAKMTEEIKKTSLAYIENAKAKKAAKKGKKK